MPTNELYLTILPLIRVPGQHLGLSGLSAGSVQQFITLFPDRTFATEFFPDEVAFYVDTFKATQKYLTGGHVIGYDFFNENTTDGRVIVRVVQHVS